MLVDEVLDLVPPGLTVQRDVKAHADAALARRTVDALAAVSARRPDAGRVEVLSFHAAAVEQAVSHGLVGRLVVWGGLRAHRPRAVGRRSRPLITALRDAGLSVTTNTVNHAAIAERALAHSPNALTTDRPHQLAAELAARRLLAA